MKDEIERLTLRLKRLSKIYTEQECTRCMAIQQYIPLEYKRITTRLHSLERLSSANNTAAASQMNYALREAGMLGMYILV